MKIAAIIVNFFIPGIGTLMVKKIMHGIIQLVMLVFGLILTFTGILAIIGAPTIIVAWIWSLVSAATAETVRV